LKKKVKKLDDLNRFLHFWKPQVGSCDRLFLLKNLGFCDWDVAKRRDDLLGVFLELMGSHLMRKLMGCQAGCVQDAPNCMANSLQLRSPVWQWLALAKMCDFVLLLPADFRGFLALEAVCSGTFRDRYHFLG
jgi:hypothetical protein